MKKLKKYKRDSNGIVVRQVPVQPDKPEPSAAIADNLIYLHAYKSKKKPGAK